MGERFYLRTMSDLGPMWYVGYDWTPSREDALDYEERDEALCVRDALCDEKDIPRSAVRVVRVGPKRPAAPASADAAELREVLAEILAGPSNEPPRWRDPGAAPLHAHRVPGRWDRDGSPCAWCALWARAEALVAEKAPPAAPVTPGRADGTADARVAVPSPAARPEGSGTAVVVHTAEEADTVFGKGSVIARGTRDVLAAMPDCAVHVVTAADGAAPAKPDPDKFLPGDVWEWTDPVEAREWGQTAGERVTVARRTSTHCVAVCIGVDEVEWDAEATRGMRLVERAGKPWPHTEPKRYALAFTRDGRPDGDVVGWAHDVSGQRVLTFASADEARAENDRGGWTHYVREYPSGARVAS